MRQLITLTSGFGRVCLFIFSLLAFFILTGTGWAQPRQVHNIEIEGDTLLFTFADREYFVTIGSDGNVVTLFAKYSSLILDPANQTITANLMISASTPEALSGKSGISFTVFVDGKQELLGGSSGYGTLAKTLKGVLAGKRRIKIEAKAAEMTKVFVYEEDVNITTSGQNIFAVTRDDWR